MDSGADSPMDSASDAGTAKEKEKKEEEEKEEEKKKKEAEELKPLQVLSNPSRVVPIQEKYIKFDLGRRNSFYIDTPSVSTQKVTGKDTSKDTR